MSDVTALLQAVNRGEDNAEEDLLRTVYEELRQIAASKLSRESPGQTLQATALVHEAYLRLLGSPAGSDETNTDPAAEKTIDATASPSVSWDSSGHFFAAAAESMRRILIDHARQKKRLKRGGGRARVDFDNIEPAAESAGDDIIAIDDALRKLESEDAEIAQIVKLRYFAGLTISQTALAMNLSEPTVKRRWFYARAWLRREMGSEDEATEET